MLFTNFISLLAKRSKQPLGGLAILLEMVPEIRKKISEDSIAAKKPRKAAVIALFYPNKKGETCFSLMQRAHYNGAHSAQISFPGGKAEPTDKDLVHTALRETEEEFGIQASSISIIKEMTSTYIPPSNFLVVPFVGLCNSTPIFKPNNEVEKIIEIKVSELLHKENSTTTFISTSYMKKAETPCFTFNGHIVWGATAMMLNEIKHMLKHA